MRREGGHTTGCDGSGSLGCTAPTIKGLADGVARDMFCDQASFLTTAPAWTPQQVADYGPICTPESATATAGFLKAMVTEKMPADQFQWIVDLNLKMPRRAAAELLYNHCH